MKRFLIGLSLAVALSFGLLGTAAAPRASAEGSVPAHWSINYKYHWFQTLAKCRTWGNGAVHGNSVQKKIPYVDKFRCHKNWGDGPKSKWSIDLHWKAMPCGSGGGAGCGGGGGGGGSWAVGIGRL